MAELSVNGDAVDGTSLANVAELQKFANSSSLLSDDEQLAPAGRCAPLSTTTAAVQAPLVEYAELRRLACDDRIEPATIHPDAKCTVAHDRAEPVCLKESSIFTQKKVPVTTNAEEYIPEMPMPPDEVVESAIRDAYSYAQNNIDELLASSGHKAKKDVLIAHSSPSSAVTYDTGPPARIERIDSHAIEESRMGHDGCTLAIDSKREEMCKLETEDVSTVDSVTNNLGKVSIQPNVSIIREYVEDEHSKALENCKDSELQILSACQALLEARGNDIPVNKTAQHIEPLLKMVEFTEEQSKSCHTKSCHNNKKPCLVKENCILCTEKEAVIDHDDDENADNETVVKEEADSLNEGLEEGSEDSDSSSSTSTLAFSSSSDEEADNYCPSRNPMDQFEVEPESECEEGELKESPLQRKKLQAKKHVMAAESSDEGEGPNGLPQSKNKINVLPHVPNVSVILLPHHTMIPAGLVSSIVGVNVIVEGMGGQQPLSEGSILWLTAQRLPLGIVDELFGPVKKPFYVVRYNDASEVPKGAKEGAHVSYVQEFSDFVINNPDLFAKAYDNGGENSEELSDSEVYFSDDEKEAAYKRSKSSGKRGNVEIRTLDNNPRQHQERKSQGKRSSRDKRNQTLGAENKKTPFPNNEFSERLLKHQNSQHRQSERDQSKRDILVPRGQGDREPLSYQRSRCDRERSYSRGRLKPKQKRKDWQSDDVLRMKHASSQEPVNLCERNSLTPPQQCVSNSDDIGVVSRTYRSHQSPRPFSQEAQSTKSNQFLQARSQQTLSPMIQDPDYLQGNSYNLGLHQPERCDLSSSQQHQPRLDHSPRQSMPVLGELNSQHCFMPQNHLPSTCNQGQMSRHSPIVPAPRAWHMNQPVNSAHMLPQFPGVQHSQIPVCNSAMVVGQVPQVAGIGYSIPNINNGNFHSETNAERGMLPRPPIFQQPVSLQAQFSSVVANQFSAPVSSHVNMQVANQVQTTQMDGYGLGLQSTVFSAPVLGIPVGQARISPSNYTPHNQHYSVFNPSCPPYWENRPLNHGLPDHARSMQPSLLPPRFSSVPGQQQQGLREDDFWENACQQRLPCQESSYKNQRF